MRINNAPRSLNSIWKFQLPHPICGSEETAFVYFCFLITSIFFSYYFCSLIQQTTHIYIKWNMRVTVVVLVDSSVFAIREYKYTTTHRFSLTQVSLYAYKSLMKALFVVFKRIYCMLVGSTIKRATYMQNILKAKSNTLKDAYIRKCQVLILIHALKYQVLYGWQK